MHCNISHGIICVIFMIFMVKFAESNDDTYYVRNNFHTKRNVLPPIKEPKIVGGSAIGIASAKHQVSLRLKLNEKVLGFGRGHMCGGSLISDRVVLTAAHCVAKSDTKPPQYRAASEFTIVMGTAALYVRDSNTLQYDVAHFLMHERYNPETIENDIGLFYLKHHVPAYSMTVAPIALNNQRLLENTQCEVTGWGKTNNNGKEISAVLMGATVPIVSNEVCSTKYGNIPSSMICAGFMKTGGVDACQGDSGGPLVCNGVLAGIVSWGNECGLRDYPGIYTNVSKYHQWIENGKITLSQMRSGAGHSSILHILLGIVVALALRY